MKRKELFLLSMVALSSFLVFVSVNPASADYKYYYHDYDEIESVLQTLESESDEKDSDVYSLQIFGYSHLGNPMYAVKFSDNPEIEEDDEPDILIDSGIHSNEWLPVESNIAFIEYLYAAYYDDQHADHDEVADMVDNFETWIIPVINPDGRMRDDKDGGDPEKFWTDTTYHAGDSDGWRMNVQEVDCEATGGTNVGIDLNRSWARRFWEYSDCRSGVYSGGAAPFGPTETKVLKQFVNNHMISLVFHQHSALNIMFSNSQTAGMGAYITVEMDNVYEENGLPDPLLALTNEVELRGGEGRPSQMKSYLETLQASEPACNGMGMTGQYFNWLWFEIDCTLSSDHNSRRGIQCVFYEFPVDEEIYGHPDDGKVGQYEKTDSSNFFHISSGESAEWIIERSIEINKYLVKQSRYPFSPRNYTDMSRKSMAPATDLAIVGAKISKLGSGLPGAFTFDEDNARDLLAGGVKTVTWNVQNNGTDTRTISSDITVCNLTDDSDCETPFSTVLTKEGVSPDAIVTLTHDYDFEPSKDYAVTLTTGETNELDNDLKRYIFTTTAEVDKPASQCPLAATIDHEGHLKTLRAVRDLGVKNRQWKKLVNIYYARAPEIVSILAQNPGLKNRLKALVMSNMIIAEELVSTGKARVGSETKKDIVSFLIELRNQGSPKLKKAISFVVDQIKKGNLFP